MTRQELLEPWSLSADQEGLAKYAWPLKSLLQLAPSGFPAHSSVRSALLALHKSQGVLGCEKRHAFKVAGEAADVWRIMCKDVYNLRKGNGKVHVEGVEELVSLIEIQPPKDQEGDTRRMEPEEVANMFPDFDAMGEDREVAAQDTVDTTPRTLCVSPSAKISRISIESQHFISVVVFPVPFLY